MTYPLIEVQVAFDTDPFDDLYPDDVEWTTLPASTVRSLDLVTGKQEALDDTQPGTLGALFDNTDRRYDPLHTTGPYYEKLIPGRRVRVRATRSGVTRSLYQGFTDGWRLSYGQSDAGTASLAATDAIKYLRRTMRNDPVSTAILAYNPTGYYRLGETSGTTLADSSGNGHDGQGDGDLKTWSTSGLVGAFDGALKLPPGDISWWFPKEVIPAWDAMECEFWFKADNPPTPSDGANQYSHLLYGGGFYVFIGNTNLPGDGPGTVYVILTDGTNTHEATTWTVPDDLVGAPTTTSSYTTVCDGDRHHIAVLYDNTYGVRVYIDGVNRTVRTVVTGSTLTGGAIARIDLNHLGLWNGDAVIDELAFCFGVPGLLPRYQEQVEAWAGDTPTDRFIHVLDSIDWPPSMRVWGLGTDHLGPASWSESTKALGYISDLVTTEQGRLVVDHWDQGQLEFRDRSQPLTDDRALTVQGIFSDQLGDTEGGLDGPLGDNLDLLGDLETIDVVPRVRYEALDIAYDEQNLIREVTVNWVDGAVTVTDPTAGPSDTINAATISTLFATEAEARSLATWILDRYSSVFVRVRSLTVSPNRLQGTAADLAWEQVLERREGDRIRIERSPGGVGGVFSFDCIIEGREHHIGDGVEDWTTRFWCTPVDDPARWWVLDSTAFDDTVLSF